MAPPVRHGSRTVRSNSSDPLSLHPGGPDERDLAPANPVRRGRLERRRRGERLADPARHFAQLYGAALSLDDPLQAFFFRATWINVIAWGLGYLLAARHPAARGPVLLAGGAGKLVYFGACLALVASGRGTAVLLASGVLDVLFAGCFLYILWVQRAGPSAGH